MSDLSFIKNTLLKNKLLDAEIRLNNDLENILTKWIINDKLSYNSMSSRLDISITSLKKIIDYYKLTEQAIINSEFRKNNASLLFSKRSIKNIY
jgi:hypothetical protein